MGVLCFALPARAQIPPEWQAAAQVVIGEFERDAPQMAAYPWGSELRQGWSLARAWRKHNNGNIEIILAEYLTFTALCRAPGCAGSTIEGQPYVGMAQRVKALHAEQGNPYCAGGKCPCLAGWPRRSDRGGAEERRAVEQGSRRGGGRLRHRQPLCAGLAARPHATDAGRAGDDLRPLRAARAGPGWLGARCVDITKIATVLDAPPKVESCS